MTRRSTDVRELPVYLVPEAAAIAGLPVSTLQTWVAGRSYAAAGGTRRSAALIRPAASAPTLLSFSNLVEVFVLAAVRRHHGVPLQRIRRALVHVEKRMGISRALIHAKFKTDGLDLFVHEIERDVLVNVSQDGQLVLKHALATRLQRIDWDRSGLAIRLFPLVRLDAPDQPRTIVVDPRRGFGHPVIAGTGIRTSVIVERYRAGESCTALAADYGIAEDKVEDAVRCALQAAA